MIAGLPPVLKIEKLSKKFGQVVAVKEVSLKIEAGEVYGLIGPNGAGKSTIIKMIVGLYPPTEGKIWIMGMNALAEPVKVKRGTGYIPDEPIAYPYLAGREWLEFIGLLHGLSRETITMRIKELAKLFDFEATLDNQFEDLSRGNKQKTVMIAALMHRPKLLIIDEPMVGLDAQSQRVTKKLITNFAQNGGAVLVCTHTLGVAQEIATRLGILHHGQLIGEGTVKELKKKANINTNNLEEIYLKLTTG